MSRGIEPFWSHGLAFCPACHEALSTEEIEWGCCDYCGGEGDEDQSDADYFDIDVSAPPEAAAAAPQARTETGGQLGPGREQ